MQPLLPPSEAFEITSTLEPYEEGDYSASLESHQRYGFKVRDLGFLIPLDTEAQIVENLPFCRIRTRNLWFLGMITFHGLMVPLFDFSILVGGKALNVEKSKIVIVGKNNDSIGILIKENPVKLLLEDKQSIDIDSNLPKIISAYVSKIYKPNLIWFEIRWSDLFSHLGDIIADA